MQARLNGTVVWHRLLVGAHPARVGVLSGERNVRAGGLKSRRTWALAGRCTARGSTEFEDGCLALIGKGHYLVKERNLACFLHVLTDRDRQP